MFKALKERVCQANLDLVAEGLVVLTWGNASGIDRERGVVVIKPSGVPYDRLQPDDMVLVSLQNGEVIDGRLRPSSDTPTHLALYRAWPDVGGIAHTHSLYATSFAQAARELPCLGTTHADYFYGSVPVTRPLLPEEIAAGYELHTGQVIIECFQQRNLDPSTVPAVFVAGHAPFTWGLTPEKAVENSIVLEFAAHMALNTFQLRPGVSSIGRELLDKHFLRKHGSAAYYGQAAATVSITQPHS